VHGAAVDRAAEEDLGANQPSARIEQEDAEDLISERRDLKAEVLPDELGAREYRGAAAEVLCDARAGVIEDLGGGSVAELIGVADKECVSHGRLQRVKLTTALQHGAEGRRVKRAWNKWRGPAALRRGAAAVYAAKALGPDGRAVRGFPVGNFSARDETAQRSPADKRGRPALSRFSHPGAAALGFPYADVRGAPATVAHKRIPRSTGRDRVFRVDRLNRCRFTCGALPAR